MDSSGQRWTRPSSRSRERRTDPADVSEAHANDVVTRGVDGPMRDDVLGSDRGPSQVRAKREDDQRCSSNSESPV